MGWMIRAWIVAFCLWTIPSQAAVLDPSGFASLGTLNTSEHISINTDALALTGGASYTGVLDPVSGAGIFVFDNISGTSLSIFGTRTLGLLSKGNIAFTGTIDLLGSGGLEVVAAGSTTLANLQTVSGGGTVLIAGNQINLRGTVDSGSRPLGVSAVEPINFSGEIGSGNITLSSGRDLIITTGPVSTGRTVNLGSGTITLTAETVSGGTLSGLVTVSSAGEIVGSPGVTIVAPVPLPPSLLFFATALVAFGVMKRRNV
jgi:hypothetical protein